MGKKFNIINAEELKKGNYSLEHAIIVEFNSLLRYIDKEIKMAHLENKNSCCVKIPNRYKNIDKYKSRTLIELKKAGYSVREKFCPTSNEFIFEVSWL